jgi:hypothetical protein
MYIEGIKEIEGSSAVGAELEERTYITLLNGDTVILECSVINYINIYFQKGNNKIVCAEIDTMARKEEEEPTDV